MRKVLGLIAVLAILWTGWWFIASEGLRGGLTTWLETRVAAGWQAEVADVEMAGFPTDLRARMVEPKLADPVTGVAVEMQDLTLAAPAWWPGHATLTLPETPILLASPQGRSFLTMTGSEMELRLHPGTALELERMGWTAGPWGVTENAGSLMSADNLTLTMTQVGNGPDYDLNAVAAGFRPGDLPRSSLRIPDDWPLTFDALALRGAVTFDRPWDRRAIEERRPQPRRIALELAEAAWADLRLNLAADLTVDEAGVPEGTLNIQAENWPLMLDLAQTAGLMPAAMRAEAEGWLRRLAGLSGNPNSLDVQLNLAGGFVAVGFIPIGPAPRLIIR